MFFQEFDRLAAREVQLAGDFGDVVVSTLHQAHEPVFFEVLDEAVSGNLGVWRLGPGVEGHDQRGASTRNAGFGKRRGGDFDLKCLGDELSELSNVARVIALCDAIEVFGPKLRLSAADVAAELLNEHRNVFDALAESRNAKTNGRDIDREFAAHSPRGGELLNVCGRRGDDARVENAFFAALVERQERAVVAGRGLVEAFEE